MKNTKTIKVRNHVAKFAKEHGNSGAGVHQVKDGRFASRARQKQNFIRSLITSKGE